MVEPLESKVLAMRFELRGVQLYKVVHAWRCLSKVNSAVFSGWFFLATVLLSTTHG